MWWTFLAAIAASSTALLIAFVAYPWQKQKDRDLQVLHEKREAYRRFICAVNGHFALLVSGRFNENDDGFDADYTEVVASTSDLIVYAPLRVAETCREFLQRVLEYGVLVRAEVGREKYSESAKKYPPDQVSRIRQARRKAIIAIRMDLMGVTENEAEKIANAFFVHTSVEEQEK